MWVLSENEIAGLAAVYRRGRVYWVRFRANGHHVRQSAHTTNKAEAAAFLRHLIAEYAAKARGGSPRHSFEEAVQRFFNEATFKRTTRVAYRNSHNMIRPFVQDRYLDEIDRPLMGELISSRKSHGVSDATIRRDLTFLSSLCAMATQWGWLDTNPVTALNKRNLKTYRPRTRFLNPQELERLLAATAHHIRPAIVLAVETGLRKEELFGLTLSHVDLTRREITLDSTKSGAPRRVPLSDQAIGTIRILLEHRTAKNSPYLLAKPDGNRFVDMKNGFEAARKRAGLNDLRWHDLRHTFASRFVQDGGDLYYLSRILGHTTVQMTARYSHMRMDDLHAELRRVAQNRSHKHGFTAGPVCTQKE